jgi:hypothetical protein
VPDQRSQHGPVGPVQPGPGIGAAQHGDLVPQHQQLNVFENPRAAEQDKPAAEPNDRNLLPLIKQAVAITRVTGLWAKLH